MTIHRGAACLVLVAFGNAAAGQYTVTNSLGRISLFRTGETTEVRESTSTNGIFLEDGRDGLARSMFARAPGRLVFEAFGRGFTDVPTQRDLYGESRTQVRFHLATGMYVNMSRSAVTVPPGVNRAFAELTWEDVNLPVNQSGYLFAGNYRALLRAFGSADGTVATASMELRFAQANTLCSRATEIGTGTHYGTTESGVAGGGALASCGDDTSPAVWYRFTAPRSGVIDVSTCGSSFDTVLSVYQSSSCPTTAQQIGCNDNATWTGCGESDSRITFFATEGVVYYIRLAGRDNASGSYVLRVGPDHDSCATARQIFTTGNYDFSTVFADTDGDPLPAGQCDNNGRDVQINNEVWFRFDPRVNGRYRLETCDRVNWDTKIAVYEGEVCQGEGSYLACSDDACGLASLVSGAAWAGSPLYFRVGGYQAERGVGRVRFTWTPGCAIDFNADGFVDFFDYLDFVTCFETGECARGRTADMNGDGFVDFFDYDDFVSLFESGGC